MGMKKWQTAELDKALAKELAEECGVDPIVALIASSRGYTDPSDLEEFLSDEPCFSDPFLLADIEKAADILNEAVESGVKIAVFGDYDCDGVSSAAIMYTYLQGRGCNCVCYIPDRMDEGYGMNIPAVEKLAADGVGLIITVDNGIACVKEVERAKELGMAVIVTDHHLPGEVLPAADAVVDPHRADCPSDFKEICGAEVAFKLICVAEGKEPEELIYEYADILSVAVTADIMPLKFENRSIVKLGIEKLKNAPSKGLSAIMSVAGLDRSVTGGEDEVSAVLAGYAVIPSVRGVCFQHLGYGVITAAVHSFKLYGPVCVQKLYVHIFFEIGEHRTVFHVVTVDNEIGVLEVAPSVKERHTALAVLAVEAAAEIFLRIGRCVHNGIADACAVNTQPPDAVGVFRNESLYIVFCHRLLGRLCARFCFCVRYGFCRSFGHRQFGNFRDGGEVLFFFLPFFQFGIDFRA